MINKLVFVAFAVAVGGRFSWVNGEDCNNKNWAKIAPSSSQSQTFQYSLQSSLAEDYRLFRADAGEKEANSLHISGTVTLKGSKKDECSYVMTFSGGKIEAKDKKGKELASPREIPTSSIKFAFKNDEILEDSMRVEKNESAWLTNMKRGILFHFTGAGEENNRTESSVFGECFTEYTKIGEGTHSKSMNMLNCVRYDDYQENYDRYGVPYTEVETAPSGANDTSPPAYFLFARVLKKYLDISPRVDCIISTSSDALSLTTCASHDSLEKIVSELKFVEKKDVAEGSDDLETNLSANLTDSASEASSSGKVGLEGVKAIMNKFENGSVNKAQMYVELNIALSDASITAEDEDKLFEGLTDLQSQTLLSILCSPEIGSSSTSFLPTCAKRFETLNMRTKLSFIAKLSQTPNPDSKALKAVTDLISAQTGKNIHINKLLLSASALAREFCKETPTCGDIPEYVTLVDTITSSADPTVLEPTVFYALGNLLVLKGKAIGFLEGIIGGNGDSRVQMLAIGEGFRSDSCQEQLKKAVEKIFSDTKVTDYIRIRAYVTFMRCFNPEKNLEVVKAVLNGGSGDLSAFITTHQKEMKSSKSSSFKGYTQGKVQESLMSETTSNLSRYLHYSTYNANRNFLTGGALEITYIKNEYEMTKFGSANLTMDVKAKMKAFNDIEVGFYSDDRSSYYLRFLGVTLSTSSSLEELIFQSVPEIFQPTSSSSYNLVDPHAITKRIDSPSLTGFPLSIELYFSRFDLFKIDLQGVKKFEELILNNVFDTNLKLNVLFESSGFKGASVGLLDEEKNDYLITRGFESNFVIGLGNGGVELETVAGKEVKIRFGKTLVKLEGGFNRTDEEENNLAPKDIHCKGSKHLKSCTGKKSNRDSRRFSYSIEKAEGAEGFDYYSVKFVNGMKDISLTGDKNDGTVVKKIANVVLASEGKMMSVTLKTGKEDKERVVLKYTTPSENTHKVEVTSKCLNGEVELNYVNLLQVQEEGEVSARGQMKFREHTYNFTSSVNRKKGDAISSTTTVRKDSEAEHKSELMVKKETNGLSATLDLHSKFLPDGELKATYNVNYEDPVKQSLEVVSKPNHQLATCKATSDLQSHFHSFHCDIPKVLSINANTSLDTSNSKYTKAVDFECFKTKSKGDFNTEVTYKDGVFNKKAQANYYRKSKQIFKKHTETKIDFNKKTLDHSLELVREGKVDLIAKVNGGVVDEDWTTSTVTFKCKKNGKDYNGQVNQTISVTDTSYGSKIVGEMNEYTFEWDASMGQGEVGAMRLYSDKWIKKGGAEQLRVTSEASVQTGPEGLWWKSLTNVTKESKLLRQAKFDFSTELMNQTNATVKLDAYYDRAEEGERYDLTSQTDVLDYNRKDSNVTTVISKFTLNKVKGDVVNNMLDFAVKREDEIGADGFDSKDTGYMNMPIYNTSYNWTENIMAKGLKNFLASKQVGVNDGGNYYVEFGYVNDDLRAKQNLI